MDNEMVTEEFVEAEVIEEKKVPKGAIIAGVAGVAVTALAGIKWLIGKLRNTNPDYTYPEDEDFDDQIMGNDLETSEEE